MPTATTAQNVEDVDSDRVDPRFADELRRRLSEESLATDPSAHATTGESAVEVLVAEYLRAHPRDEGLLNAKAKLHFLARARRWRRMTQTQVGAILGLGQPHIARLERGVSDAKLSTIEALTAALDLRLAFVDARTGKLIRDEDLTVAAQEGLVVRGSTSPAAQTAGT